MRKIIPELSPNTPSSDARLAKLIRSPYAGAACANPGFKFNFFDSLLKLASGIIFYLLNLSANLLFHTYKHC